MELNNELMIMVIESGLEVVAEKVQAKVGMMAAAELSVEELASLLEQIDFNKEAAENYALAASGLLSQDAA